MSDDTCSLAWSTIDREHSTQTLNPFTHADQPQAFVATGRQDPVETGTFVADLDS